jgi:hypothetical protein
VNRQLRDAVETHSQTLEFRSRTTAEDYAERLSASDGSLRIQSVPDNEPKAIDAYLLADHNPSIKTPAEIDGKMWTFDVGANLYGALGEAILIDAPKPHALIHYIRQDLEFDETDLEWGVNVTVERGQLLSVTSSEGATRWAQLARSVVSSTNRRNSSSPHLNDFTEKESVRRRSQTS